MKLKSEFFRYLADGRAEGATVLMARVALNLGHDAEAYPLDLSEIKRIGKKRRERASCGLNELWMANFFRAAVMREITPWTPSQVQELLLLPGVREAIEKSRAIRGRTVG